MGAVVGGFLYVTSQSVFVLLKISPEHDHLDQRPKQPTRSVASYRRDRYRKKLEEARLRNQSAVFPWKTEFEAQQVNKNDARYKHGILGANISSQTILEEDSESI